MALSLHAPRMSAVHPSATLQMAARARALAKQGVDVANLSAGEPDFKTPECIVEVARRALETRGTHAYTNARGTDELVEAIQEKFRREQGVNYDVSEVISTIGTKGALSLALDALIGPGDEVIVFSPYWVTYPDLIRLAGGTPVIVPTDIRSGYVPDIDVFSKAFTSKTKAVILNTPNNPTGAGLPEATLRAIMKCLSGTDIWVISDEIYERLTYGSFRHVSPVSLGADARSRTLYVGGVAKAYAMTGWRLGVAAGPKLLVDGMLLLQQQRVTCATGVAQAAAAYALREPAEVTAAVESMRKAYAGRRALLLEKLAAIPGLKVHPPEGAFYAFVDVRERLPGVHKGRTVNDDVQLSSLLLDEARVAVVPGTPFSAPGGLRLSFATDDATLERGIERLSQWFGDLKS